MIIILMIFCGLPFTGICLPAALEEPGILDGRSYAFFSWCPSDEPQPKLLKGG